METYSQMNRDEYQRRLAKQSNAKRHQKRRRKRHLFFSAVLVIAALGVCLFICLAVFFKIETVTVAADSLLDKQQVLEHCGFAVGDNLFRIDLEQAKKNLLALCPQADTVEITKHYPNRVDVSVRKAETDFCIKQGAVYYTLSKKGRVIEQLSAAPEGVLQLRGLSDPLKPGDFIDTQSEGYQCAQEVIGAFADAQLHDLTIVDVSDLFGITCLYQGRVRLILGTRTNLAYKAQVVQQAFIRDFPDDAMGVIDASVEGNAFVRKGKEYPAYFDEEPSAEPSSEQSVAPEENSSQTPAVSDVHAPSEPA